MLPFTLESYRVLIENRGGEVVSEATVKLVVDGERIIATREGNGPVNALDAALRAALTPSRPWLADVELSDFKVRLLAPQGAGETRGTDAVTRVLVESTDGAGSWTTVGVHGNVVEASWLALVDAVAYAGLRTARCPPACADRTARCPHTAALSQGDHGFLAGAGPAGRPATRRSPTRRPEPRGRPRAAAGPRRGRCRAVRRTRAPSTA